MTTNLTNIIKESRKRLALTQEQLATKAGVSYTTLTKIESGVIKNPSIKIISKLADALNISIDGMLDGLVSVQTEHDENAIFKIWADIIATLPDKSEMYISGVDEKLFMKYSRKGLNTFIANLKKRGIKQKLLSCEGDMFMLKEPNLEYRWIPKQYFNNNPIYCYANTVATVVWGPPTQAVFIRNTQIADAFRKQFLFSWGKAKKIKTSTK